MRKNALTLAVFALLIALFALSTNDWKLPWTKTEHGADWCAAHEIELSKCETCNPKLARGGTMVTREREPREGECPNTLVRVTLGPGVAEEIRLQTASAELRSIAESIRANAETMYLPAKYARVAPRIAGVVREVKIILGQDVEAGAPLAVIESTEFGEAKAAYLQAQAILKLRQQVYDQETVLADKGISTGRERLQAQTQLEEAKLESDRASQRLALLGLTQERIRSVAETRDTSALVEVTAPFGGRIVESSAVPGEAASPDRPIFAVADLERMWISVDLHESDLPKVERDQKTVFTVEGLPGKRFPGKIVALGSDVDDRSRTVRVFAEVKNLQGLLRANMFGRAEITVKPPDPKLLIPKDAVQNDGDCSIVFVSPSPNVYQARKVELGAAYEGGYEIVGGLAAGEKVVTTGSFLLKTEILREQIGAG